MANEKFRVVETVTVGTWTVETLHTGAIFIIPGHKVRTLRSQFVSLHDGQAWYDFPEEVPAYLKVYLNKLAAARAAKGKES